MAGRQKRSEQTMERLVAAAAELFARHGYVGATIAGISRAAGMTKGAVFFHFAAKDELAVAVQERGRERMEQAALRLEAAGGPYLQTVVDLTYVLGQLLREDVYVQATVRIARERRGGVPAGSGAAAGTDRLTAHEDPLDFYCQWLGRLGELLDRARHAGELAGSVPRLSAHTPVTAAVSGLETLTWLGVPKADCEAWLTDLWDLTLPALASAESLRKVRTVPPG